MSVLICPGIHSSQLTESFLQALQAPNHWLVFPTHKYPAYSAIDVCQFLEKYQLDRSPVLLISYSAGVVGAIGAAHMWQIKGNRVKAKIAIDGWGVPLIANFPIHRLSHDYFTHWSSSLLDFGHTERNFFYADPQVEHLDMWRSPQNCLGWWIEKTGLKIHCSALDALRSWLTFYGEM